MSAHCWRSLRCPPATSRRTGCPPSSPQVEQQRVAVALVLAGQHRLGAGRRSRPGSLDRRHAMEVAQCLRHGVAAGGGHFPVATHDDDLAISSRAGSRSPTESSPRGACGENRLLDTRTPQTPSRRAARHRCERGPGGRVRRQPRRVRHPEPVRPTLRAAASVPTDWQVQVTPQGDVADVAKDVHALRDLRAVEPAPSPRDIAELARFGGCPRHRRRLRGLDPPVLRRQLPGRASTPGGGELRQPAAPADRRQSGRRAGRPGDRADRRWPRWHSSGRRRRHASRGLGPPGRRAGTRCGCQCPSGQRAAGVTNHVPPTRRRDDSGPAAPRRVPSRRAPDRPPGRGSLARGRATHLQAAVAGGALVGDNLGTALTAAGEDARYATLLFLLLGVPGLVLAVVVAALVVALRSERRRREVALLRICGARDVDLLRIVGTEALLTAATASALGLGVALLANWLALAPGTGLTLRGPLPRSSGGSPSRSSRRLDPARPARPPGQSRSRRRGGARSVLAHSLAPARRSRPAPARCSRSRLLVDRPLRVPGRAGSRGRADNAGELRGSGGTGACLAGAALLVWRITALVVGGSAAAPAATSPGSSPLPCVVVVRWSPAAPPVGPSRSD